MAKLSQDKIQWILSLNATQAQEQIHALTKENEELKKKADAARKALAEAAPGSEEWKNANNALKSYNATITSNKKQIEELNKRTNDETKTLKQLRKELKDAKKEFENTSKATHPERYKELQTRIGQLSTAIDNAAGKSKKLESSWKAVGKLKQVMIGVFTSIGYAITENIIGAFKNAFNIIVDFEKANSTLASILGTTKDQIGEMTKAARQLGATTSYSAAEVTQLQIELAKLGFAKEEILNMEGATLKFAKAVGTDLGRAAAFAGAALRIFGKDSSQTEEALASFAIATTKTSLDFSKLETSLSTVGPVAASFGLSLEDTTALLGQLANAGFDASSAATATRNILLNLCDANGDLAKALGQPVKTADDLAAGLKKLNSEGIDLAKALELTDARSVAAFSTFLNNADTLTELRDSITGVTDAFTDMSDEAGNNVAGALAGLQSASEELILRISEGTEGPLKSLIEMLTSLVAWISGTLVPWFERWGTVITTVVVAIGTYKATVILATAATKAWKAATEAFAAIQASLKARLVATTTAVKLYQMALQDGMTKTEALKFATSGLGKAMKSLPVVSILAALAAITTATIVLIKKLREHNEVQEAINSVYETATKQCAAQTAAIQKNIAIAENERLSMNMRLQAIKELNETVPGYNAQIDETTGKYTASKDALDEYLKSLEKELVLKASQTKLEELLRKRNELAFERKKANEEAEKERQNNRYKQNGANPTTFTSSGGGGAAGYSAGYAQASHAAQDYAAQVEKDFKKAEDNVTEFQTFLKEQASEVASTLETTVDSESSTVDDATAETSKLGTAAHDTTEKLLKAATAAADLAHQTRLLAIEEYEPNLTANENAIAKAEETIQWAAEANAALATLAEETDKTNTALLDKIARKQAENDRSILAAKRDIDKAQTAMMEEAHASRLAAINAFYAEQQRIIMESVAKGETTQEAADLYMTARTREQHMEQLAELEAYYDEVMESTTMGNEERLKAEEKLQADIASMRTQVLTDTASWAAKIRELTQDTESRQGMLSHIETQRTAVTALYDTIRAEAEKNGEDVAAIEEAKQRKLAELDEEQRQRLFELAQTTGVTWADEYENELAKLKAYHDKGMIEEKEYQKARLNLQVQNAKKYFDLYSGQATSMFSAVQEAEIAASDAKYDVLIRQAENNGEDTAELEQEKENKKLEIQKKYADVNFAMKAGQIIADTAVAIMKAFADLGPIGGAISAAMLTATGAAQLAIANSERQRIKSMQPANVKSSASETATTPTAVRKLTGYSDGGYTGDGGRFEPAGIVHKGEYVVPMPIMEDPAVLDAVEIIEAVRRDRMNLPSAPQGRYADGGYTSLQEGGSSGLQGAKPSGISELHNAVMDMRKAIEGLGDLKAYVVLRDLENAQKKQSLARAPFTRNQK